ncbi:hypothetical protein GCM10007935_07780 [Hydrogenophaga electricum]|uniref:Uncharacterized protein n=1 Tax=Hydrogenophaga electricum TaxID=1230953 RepID=A0ABQ6C2X3_9BURK|nr:hypothetical protein GCM10007935_07780 [Hydrogenophaga electricum]
MGRNQQSYVYWWDKDNANARLEPSLTLSASSALPLLNTRMREFNVANSMNYLEAA